MLNEIVTLSPDGRLAFDYHTPRQKGSLSTGIRKEFGFPVLIQRHRKIPGSDRDLTMFFAYSKDKAPSEIYHQVKSIPPGADHLLRRTAIYAAAYFQSHALSFDAVVPVPSSKPFAKSLASEIAKRLQVPLLDGALVKMEKVGNIGVHQRMDHAVDNFVADDVPGLNGHVLIVDDFSTSGSSIVGAAANLLMVPDVTDVTGFAMSIAN